MWKGIQIGDSFMIPSFGIMIFLAFVTCNYFIRKTLREKKIDVEIGDNIIFWAAFGGILGAKLYYLIEFGFEPLLSFVGLAILYRLQFKTSRTSKKS